MSFCPRCGKSLELDPDGGWCDNCGAYYDKVDLEETLAEEESEEDEDDVALDDIEG